MELANKLLCRFGFSSTLDKYQAAANVVFKDSVEQNHAAAGGGASSHCAPAAAEKPAKRGKTSEKVASAYQYASAVSSSTLSDLELPRIIVIGDEKAGKSSTLERIACVDIFTVSNLLIPDVTRSSSFLSCKSWNFWQPFCNSVRLEMQKMLKSLQKAFTMLLSAFGQIIEVVTSGCVFIFVQQNSAKCLCPANRT